MALAIQTTQEPRNTTQDRRTLEGHGIGFYLTIDEEAEGSLDMVKCLDQQEEVIYFERTKPGMYFIVGDENKIDEICADFPNCLMKKEAVK